jgi:hypothetical protein
MTWLPSTPCCSGGVGVEVGVGGGVGDGVGVGIGGLGRNVDARARVGVGELVGTLAGVRVGVGVDGLASTVLEISSALASPISAAVHTRTFKIYLKVVWFIAGSQRVRLVLQAGEVVAGPA